MDVTIVIPTHNRRELVGVALWTALGQRDVDVEVVVVDDGSSDDTSGFVEAWDDPRIRLVRHDTPRGPNAARNAGARASDAPWIAFLDDDDAWAPGKLGAQLGAARATGRRWVYAGSVNVDRRLRVIHGVPPPDVDAVASSLRRYNAIPASASNVVIERASFDRHGGFDESLRACEEWDLWLRLLHDGIPSCVARPLVAYRMHRSNATLDVAAIVEGARAIERLHSTTVDWGRVHRWIAQLCLRDGDRLGAARQYVRAAARGATSEVATDVAALARRALHRRGLARPPQRPGGDDAWEAGAEPWLADVRRWVAGAEGGGS